MAAAEDSVRLSDGALAYMDSMLVEVIEQRVEVTDRFGPESTETSRGLVSIRRPNLQHPPGTPAIWG